MADSVQTDEISEFSPRSLFWPLFLGLNALHYFGGELRFLPWRFLLCFAIVLFCVVMARKAGRVGDTLTRVVAWLFAVGYVLVILFGILNMVEQTS